jgi:hypothetical protein
MVKETIFFFAKSFLISKTRPKCVKKRGGGGGQKRNIDVSCMMCTDPVRSQ